ncbi:hypothetical protein EYF80_049253 [Liparis tanakae]|uniref:Uncharacterized protein n=1 Tax=Liparis tanakae TaxID=230148 RepID=A0A4Z2FJV9_9TELE|nr:hypothetical protein EYF80_049253 [Liparis tanakae]
MHKRPNTRVVSIPSVSERRGFYHPSISLTILLSTFPAFVRPRVTIGEERGKFTSRSRTPGTASHD